MLNFVEEISFEEIKEIWERELWPNKKNGVQQKQMSGLGIGYKQSLVKINRWQRTQNLHLLGLGLIKN